MDYNEVINKIKAGDKLVLEDIYSKYRSEFIGWMISTHHVTMNDAKDIYQQSILVFYENIVNGKLIEMNSNIKTYLYAVGKNKYSELKRHWSRQTAEMDFGIPDSSVAHEENEREEILIHLSEKALTLLGNPCKELLELYYYHKKSMLEISQIQGYKNEDSAKNQKYKCLVRLKEIFQTELKKNNIPLYE